jgi:hypothetical protein
VDQIANLDSAKVAGLLVIGSVLVLSLLRKGWGDVNVRIGG